MKRFWPGQDPIGKRIKFGQLTSSAGSWLSIVGVVGEVKYRGLPDNPTADPDIYLPFVERNSQYAIAVRTAVPPSSLVAPLRAVIRSADPSIPIYQVSTMEELVASQTSQSRFTMWLMGVFAAVALTLSVIGIYGVMSYLVSQRTREIGIRLALGAGGRDILRLVVGNGARLIAGGILHRAGGGVRAAAAGVVAALRRDRRGRRVGRSPSRCSPRWRCWRATCPRCARRGSIRCTRCDTNSARGGFRVLGAGFWVGSVQVLGSAVRRFRLGVRRSNGPQPAEPTQNREP